MAQFKLAISYFEGHGVPQDYVEAYAWLNVAVAKVPRMKEFRDQWAKDMTPAQIAEAQALSREYWKAYGGSGD